MDNKLKEVKKSLPFERTVVFVKPDGIQRGLVGDVISRFEKKGLKLIGLKMMTVSDALVRDHYSHHVDKPFFKSLSKFITSSPIVVMVWEGVEAVEAVRIICGSTSSRKADAGTIRGDLGMGFTSNVVHASDSVENVEKEIKRFFKDDELFDYDKTEYLHIYYPEI